MEHLKGSSVNMLLEKYCNEQTIYCSVFVTFIVRAALQLIRIEDFSGFLCMTDGGKKATGGNRIKSVF